MYTDSFEIVARDCDTLVSVGNIESSILQLWYALLCHLQKIKRRMLSQPRVESILVLFSCKNQYLLDLKTMPMKEKKQSSKIFFLVLNNV